MSEPNPLQQLYEREINFKIEAFWDGGFDVALGDALNDYKAQSNTKFFADAVGWLVDAAAIHFPNVPEEEDDRTLQAE